MLSIKIDSRELKILNDDMDLALRKLNKAPTHISDDVAESTVRNAQRYAPVARGFLRDSIRWSRLDEKRVEVYADARSYSRGKGDTARNYPYAVIQEVGYSSTRKAKTQSHMVFLTRYGWSRVREAGPIPATQFMGRGLMDALEEFDDIIDKNLGFLDKLRFKLFK